MCNTPFGAVTFKSDFKRKQTEPEKQAKKEKYLQPLCREVMRNKSRVGGMIPAEMNWQHMKAATNLGSVVAKLTPAFIH